MSLKKIIILTTGELYIGGDVSLLRTPFTKSLAQKTAKHGKPTSFNIEQSITKLLIDTKNQGIFRKDLKTVQQKAFAKLDKYIDVRFNFKHAK